MAAVPMLISPAELESRLGDPGTVVLDVSAKLTSDLQMNRAIEELTASRIPGSRFFDVATSHGALSDRGAALPWTWPAPEVISESLASVGVTGGTHVVIAARSPRPFIDWGTMWCTRTWWLLHHGGIPCSILHGGLERWEAEGRPLESGPLAEPASAPAPRVVDGRDVAMATKADILAVIESGNACLIDALNPESYRGEETTYGRAGHIPTARNVPFYGLVDQETALFPRPDELRSRLVAAATPFDHDEVITYCGGAIAGSVPAFALKLLGHDRVRLYDGSLLEWASDATLPLETGE